jgi:hypothetical protein
MGRIQRLLCSVLLFSVASAWAFAPGDKVEVTQDVPVLGKANRSVGTLRQGDIVIVIKEKGKWVGIKNGPVKGWVKGSALKLAKIARGGDDFLEEQTSEGRDEQSNRTEWEHPFALEVGGSFATNDVGLGVRLGFFYALPLGLPSQHLLEAGLNLGFYPLPPATGVVGVSAPMLMDPAVLARYSFSPVENFAVGIDAGVSPLYFLGGSVGTGASRLNIAFDVGGFVGYSFAKGWGVNAGGRYLIRDGSIIVTYLQLVKRF